MWVQLEYLKSQEDIDKDDFEKEARPYLEEKRTNSASRMAYCQCVAFTEIATAL